MRNIHRILTITLTLLLTGVIGCAPRSSADSSSSESEAAAATEEEVAEAENEILAATDEVAEELRALRLEGRMLEELGLDATGVDVELHGTTAVLSGEVSREETLELAEQIALASDGVTEVDHRVRLVDSSGDEASKTPVADTVADVESEVADAVLETRAKAALLSTIGSTAFDVEVEASSGEVSLRGDVVDEDQHRAALDAVKATEGVQDVVDLLEVRNS